MFTAKGVGCSSIAWSVSVVGGRCKVQVDGSWMEFRVTSVSDRKNEYRYDKERDSSELATFGITIFFAQTDVRVPN